MKKSIILFFVGVLFCSSAFGLTVNARSLSSGTYEDGIFKQGSDGFEAEYVIDEKRGTITLARIISNDREGKYSAGVTYDITNTMRSEGLSAFLVSRDKKGQKMYTGVRGGDLGSFETIIIGEDFYEYSKAANGKFYLEYGEVKAAK